MTASATTLRIGVPYTPSGIDPHVNSSELAYKFFSNVFDPLVWRTPSGEYVPSLATRWEIAPDGLAYTFDLRTDVTFHDGVPLDAAAVKASFDRIVDPATKSQAAKDMLGPYAGCDVLDRYTVRLRLAEPYAPFLDALAQAWLAPASPKAVAELGAEHLRRPVGTGPYRIESWEPGQELVLVANAAYQWAPPCYTRQGPPSIERIEIVFLPDLDARLEALRSGDIQAFYELAPEQVAAVSAIPGFTVDLVPVPGAPVSLMLNTQRTPTDDLTVRQALAHAIDVPEVVRRAFDGLFPVATAPLSSTTWGYPGPDDGVIGRYPHDPERAAALLDEAGWRLGPDGKRSRSGESMVLPYYAIPHARYPQIGAELRRQLAAFGIEVDVHVVSIAEWLAAGNSGAHNLVPVGKFTSEPDILEMLFHSRHNGNGYAWTWSQDDALDALLQEAVRTLDVPRRTVLFRQIQQRISSQARTVPIHENTNVSVRANTLHGLTYDLRGYPVLYEATLGSEARP